MIRCQDIVKLTKEKTARVIPNAIQICTRDDRYFFASFGARDKVFIQLDLVRKNAINEIVSFKPWLNDALRGMQRISEGWIFELIWERYVSRSKPSLHCHERPWEGYLMWMANKKQLRCNAYGMEWNTFIHTMGGCWSVDDDVGEGLISVEYGVKSLDSF